LFVALEFSNRQEKIQVAAISLVLTLAPWQSNKQAETTLFVASLPKGPRQGLLTMLLRAFLLLPNRQCKLIFAFAFLGQNLTSITD
jgi:hypothetical protein